MPGADPDPEPMATPGAKLPVQVTVLPATLPHGGLGGEMGDWAAAGDATQRAARDANWSKNPLTARALRRDESLETGHSTSRGFTMRRTHSANELRSNIKTHPHKKHSSEDFAICNPEWNQ